MVGDWRRFAVALLAAAAVGMVGVVNVEAQAPAKKAAAKKAKAAAPAEQEAESEDAPKTAPPKKKRQDAAEAQRAIEAALKLLEAGKAEPATQALTTVLTGGNLPPAIMARALYYRGIAYRQQKKPAQAIADLTSALWLKGGLGGSDRTDALKQRASAYQEAGLTDGGETVAAVVPSASSRPAMRTASAAQSWGTETTTSSIAQQQAPAATKPASSGWGIPNPFAGWFGGSTASSPSPPQSPSPPSPSASAPPTTASIAPPVEPTAVAARTSAWTNNTEVQRGGAAPVATPVAAAKPEGRFRIQVGMVRTEGEAQALAAKVKQHGAAVAAREPEVDQTVVGNMGSFYRVRVGPFATQADGQVACTKLKGSGLDCLVVAQ